VRDADGTLIDGRNRLAACKLLKIKPEETELDGDHAVAFIISRNLKRRNLNRGQQAMLVALGVKRDASAHEASRETGIHQTMISRARFIIEHEPKLVDEVLAGIKSLDLAYDEAKANEKKAQSDESKLKRLSAKAPDLAEQVADGKLTLAEGIGALDARENEAVQKEQEREQERQALTQSFGMALLILSQHTGTVTQRARDLWQTHDPKTLKMMVGEVTKERLKRCIDVLKELEKQWNYESKY
jgi:flagellin-specific chaperone FliS